MRRQNDIPIPYPLSDRFFDDSLCGQTSFDPLGSYTGRTPDRDEIPVQDADDL